MNELDRLKSKIRQCDATILEALLERNKGIEEITLYKKEHGLPFFQREQEMGIQKWLKSETVGKPHKQEVEDVFFSIYKGAKKIQAEKAAGSEYFSYWFHGLWKIHSGRFFESGIIHGSNRDGSDHCKAGRHEYFRYL